MKEQRFVIWLKGFLDACESTPNEKQVFIIKDTLNSLFEHVADKPQIKQEIKYYDIPTEPVFRC